MGFFSSKKDSPKTITPKDMSPVQVVTHLFAIVQLSDNEVAYEEREAWAKALDEMFPMHSSERSEQFLNDAFAHLNQLNQNDYAVHLKQVLDQIKATLPEEHIKGQLKNHLKNLIIADGMVMSGELNAIQIIENHLDIKVEGLDE
jgi:uncharacterized tellurite resistance protein B-like protein